MTLDWEKITEWEVLLVDDEPDNIEVVAESLEFYGMTVRTAENGQLAVDALQDEWLPDLILLDLSMPVMDGWATLRKLKSDERTQSITVLALSAHAIIGDAERAVNAGFDGYMTKPISVPTLLQDLRSALKHRNISNDLDPQPSVTKDESVS
jgi:two-component system, cell cycle response regulator DivK